MTDTTTGAGTDRLAEAKRLLLAKRLRGEATPLAPRETIGRAAEPGPAYPMSYQQESLWFLDRLQPGSPVYNIPAANLVSARIDVPTLERALSEVIRRHQAIRTVFRQVDGKLVQVVQPPYALHIPVDELRGPGGEPAPAEVVLRKASEWGALPFDLEHGPLFRCKLFRVSEEDYLIVFNIHHIVTDGWAMPIITREMEELYVAYSRGEPSPLADPAIQYTDYAVWQRRHLSGPTLQRLTDYWKGHLEGAPTALELPYDRPRPPVQSNRGAIHRFVYPAALLQSLRALGRQEGVTVNMVFMAGFNLLLQRYSGQDDQVVGTLLGNRNRAELEPLVGYFVSSGAIRTRLDGDPTFREVVRRVRTAILDADAHQELPFDMVVDALKVPRDAGRNPVFQVMYFHHTFVGSHHLDDEAGMAGSLDLRSLYQEAEAVLVDTGAAKFDLSVATLEMEGRMPGMVEYATDLFDHATIARMVAHLGVLLEEGCAHPDVPISRLEMTAEEERRTLLAWGSNERPWPRGESLGSLFARQAAATPDAAAVEFEDATFTYRELDEHANRIARHLAALGVGAGDCVGVAAESSARTVAGLLAIARAGAAAVPLEPAYPAERLAFMVRDTRARVVLAAGGRLEWLAEAEGVAVVGLDEAWETIARHSAAPFASPAGPESVGIIYYTSGSTGTPKGVRVHHRGMVRTVAGVAYAPLRSGERVAQQTTLAFDASFGEIWGALLNGATLVGIPRDVLLSPADYARTVREKRIGVAFITTQLFNQLVREAPDALGSLRAVLVGGEKADPEAMRLCLRGTPPAALLHMYGPTEASLFTTCHRVTHLADDAATVPIGRPIDNTRVYVLAPGGTFAGIGVPGELCAGGDGVAAGYLDRPALTAERFVADPFVPGATMYRTGDRVRWTPDGVIEFIGRVDDQVKVRGYRIELGEVEGVLRQHPALRDAAVAVREEPGAERKLVGYVVAGDGGPNAAELRAWMKERLPDHMVPTVFVELDALPLMPNGKVDRRRLPAPDGRRLETGDAHVAPRTEAEQTLARIWAEVLRVDRVGVHDNFFALGGDSILSIQIVSRAGEAGLRVMPRHVFMHQTVAELAAVAGQAVETVAEQGAVTGPVPLTPVQRWFLAQALPDPAHFNLTLVFEPRERLDADALAGACAAVLAHHDALRLRYERDGEGGWRQTNDAPPAEPPLELVDLSSLPGEAREAAFTARAGTIQRALDLARGPLVRFALFELGGGAQRLLVAAHHLVMDAVSLGFVTADLETAYRQLARGEAVSLPRKTTSFREWAERLAEHARGGDVRAQAPYWLEQGGAAPLPVDLDAGSNAESEAGTVTVELDEETTRALLHDVPPVYGTQVNDVLLAALARAFRGWTGERALKVDLEGHGREAPFDGVDLSRTAGWFTAIYPVRLELTEEGAPGADLVAVKEQLRAVPGKGLSHGLLRWMADDGEIRHELESQPRPQVSFNYLGRMEIGAAADDGLLVAADVDAGAARGPAAERTHLLGLDAAVSEGRLSATWTYGRRIHHAETVRRLASAFADELRTLVAHCRDPHAGGPTPSDFELAGLDQGGLDALLAQIGG